MIVLCDFGGSGTSITLADATSNDAPIGEIVRVADFSGDRIDQALLASVVAGHGSQADPYGSAMVGSLVRLRRLLSRRRSTRDPATEQTPERRPSTPARAAHPQTPAARQGPPEPS